MLYESSRYGGLELAPDWVYATPVVFGFFAVNAAARYGLRALLAPTVAEDESAAIEIGADEIVFDAVAVTRETQAAVAALAVVSLATFVAWLASLPILRLSSKTRTSSPPSAST